MNQNIQTESPRPQSIQAKRALDFYVFYANYLRMRVAPGEFGLAFGFTDDTQDGPLTEEKMLVAFSPHTAKMLSIALNAALDVYERQNGPIRKPVNTSDDTQNVHKAIDEAMQTFLASS